MASLERVGKRVLKGSLRISTGVLGTQHKCAATLMPTTLGTLGASALPLFQLLAPVLPQMVFTFSSPL